MIKFGRHLLFEMRAPEAEQSSGPDNGFDGLFEGYTWTIPDNTGTGRYRGIEFGYNQPFTFLPGFWRGFSAGFNYTRTDSHGDFGGTLATSLVANQTRIVEPKYIGGITGRF